MPASRSRQSLWSTDRSLHILGRHGRQKSRRRAALGPCCVGDGGTGVWRRARRARNRGRRPAPARRGGAEDLPGHRPGRHAPAAAQRGHAPTGQRRSLLARRADPHRGDRLRPAAGGAHRRRVGPHPGPHRRRRHRVPHPGRHRLRHHRDRRVARGRTRRDQHRRRAQRGPCRSQHRPRPLRGARAAAPRETSATASPSRARSTRASRPTDRRPTWWPTRPGRPRPPPCTSSR